MKLSHALARGIEICPKQCYNGQLHYGPLASCVLGAICDGLNDLGYSGSHRDGWDVGWDVNFDNIVGDMFNVGIEEANDDLRISREAFLQMLVEAGL